MCRPVSLLGELMCTSIVFVAVSPSSSLALELLPEEIGVVEGWGGLAEEEGSDEGA